MTKKIIHTDVLDAGKLCCDNPTCGHQLPTPLRWGPHLIGYPCPKCGSDMLTRKDFDAVEAVNKLVVWVNKWFGWLGSEKPDATHTRVTIKIGGPKP